MLQTQCTFVLYKDGSDANVVFHALKSNDMGYIQQKLTPVVVKYDMAIGYDLFATGEAQVLREEINDFEVTAPEVTILTCFIAGSEVYPYSNPEFPADLLRAIEAEAIHNSSIPKYCKE